MNDTNNIKVIVRVRPPIREDYENEYGEPFQNIVRTFPDHSAICLTSPAGVSEREFPFNAVFDSSTSQDDVYSAGCVDVVQDVLDGYNSTIMAYGQTGTGKSFTIFGPGSDWERPEERKSSRKPDDPPPFSQCGIVPRAILQIFDYIEENSADTEFRVSIIMDLLDQSKNNLVVREDKNHGVFIDNLTYLQADNPAQVLDYIREGASNRAISSTAMNKTSSRSHVILQLTVEQRSKRDNSGVKRGALSIIDLAGSERVAKTGSEGFRLEEAKKINKSLSALGNVVAALSSGNKAHVPFRDSKLTRLLSDSLGGNSKTCLCVCIGPAAFNYEETYSSLHFATRAMAVKNCAVVNEVAEFNDGQSSLEAKIMEYESKNQVLLEQNSTLEKQIQDLRTTVESLQTKPIQSNQQSLPSSPLSLGYRQSVPVPHSIPPSFASSPTDSISERLTLLTTPPRHRSRDLIGSSSLNRSLSWEEREKELVLHYTKIINDLTTKLDRYKWLSGAHSHKYSEGKEAIYSIDKLVEFLVSEDVIKKRLVEKVTLDQDFP
ncbi:hypothetical protein GEMRC1_004667 [Eukaryota sp. GEM-RC1]